MTYEHPLYTPRIGCRTTPPARDQHAAHRLRRRLPRLGVPRGRGAVRCRAADALGVDWDRVGPRRDRAKRQSDEGVTRARIYATSVHHARKEPVAHRFRTRSHSWLVDLDDLPRLGRLAAVGELRGARPPRRPVADAARRTSTPSSRPSGVDLRGGQILMLAMPRVLGTVFNPHQRLLVPRPRRRARVHRRRGAQHLWRPARLPRAR